MIFIYPHAKFRVKIMTLDFYMRWCCCCAMVCPHVPCCAQMACTSRPQCACQCTNGLHQWADFAPQRALQCLLRKNSCTKFKTSRPEIPVPLFFTIFQSFKIRKIVNIFLRNIFHFRFFSSIPMIFIYPHAKFRVKIMTLDFYMRWCCCCAMVCPHVPCCAQMACTSRPQCACQCTNGLHQWADFAPQRALQCLLRKNSCTKFKTSRTIFCPNKIDIFRSTIKPIPA